MLDADLRHALRHAIDARMRARIADDDAPRCGECGVEMSQQLDGCRTCWERHRSRNRRATQADVMRAYDRAYKQRMRARS